MKKILNALINFILNNLVIVRKNRLAYNLAVEKNVVEKDNLKNKFIFSIVYNVRFILYFTKIYLLWGLIVVFISSEGDICLDNGMSDFDNRLLYLIIHPLVMTCLIFVIFKIIDGIYLLTKFIQNKIK